MKIRGWAIDGFGVFRDWSIAGLPDGLTVLHGANEAGKSTILEFLRRILFDSGDARAARDYAPLNGGAYRGRLVVANGDGELIVERDFEQRAQPRLRSADGRMLDGAALHHLLGGADERLFRSVFAFSLDDLRSLAVLDAGGVREALFSAALAGAGRSARTAAQALRAEAAARLDGEGAAQVNQLIADLDALRPRLNAARRAALAYPEQRAAVERLGAALDEQRNGLARRRAVRARDEALLRAWPAWEALQAARRELAATEPVTMPPPDAEAQLREAREQLGAALGAVRVLRLEQSQAERRADTLPNEEIGAAANAEVEALSADLPLYRFNLAALPNVRRRRAEAEQILAERLLRAGPQWTAERLRTWARAGVDRDSVRDWQVRMRAAVERSEQAQWRHDSAAAAADSARRERDRTLAELPAGAESGVRPPPANGVEVEQRRQGLAELRAALEEMLSHRALGEGTAQSLHEHERTLRDIDADGDPPPPVWLSRSLAGLGAASGAALVWLLSRGDLPTALVAAVVAVAAIVGERWAAQRERAYTRREAQREEARRALRSEMEGARRRRDTDWHRAAQLTDEVARRALALGLPRSPSIADIDLRERAIADELAAAARSELLRGRLESMAGELRQREEEERARADEAAAAAAARVAIEAQWDEWSAAGGFAGEAPDAVLAHVTALEAAQGALATLDAAAGELRHLEPLVTAWEGRARSALVAHGVGDAVALGGEALIERVLAMRRRLQEEAPQRARRVALMDEIGDRAARLSAAEAEVSRCQLAIDAALRRAGVGDEAELARRRVQADRREALLAAVAEREQALSERLGDEAAVPALSEGAVDTWRQRAEQADEEIATLEQRLYQLVIEHQQQQTACKTMEESSAVADLEGQWAALMAELEEAVHEWRVLVAAEGLIDEARQNFERTRQPSVLSAASLAFAAVTAGRYERIAQDEGGQELIVVERGGRRKQVASQLSRGTTEQLYLSLRLGLAKELGRRGTGLPLVMDDVLVNFDAERAGAMATVLGDFAREQQVLFFTCHSVTRDLLIRHAGAARVVEL